MITPVAVVGALPWAIPIALRHALKTTKGPIVVLDWSGRGYDSIDAIGQKMLDQRQRLLLNAADRRGPTRLWVPRARMRGGLGFVLRVIAKQLGVFLEEAIVESVASLVDQLSGPAVDDPVASLVTLCAPMTGSRLRAMGPRDAPLGLVLDRLRELLRYPAAFAAAHAGAPLDPSTFADGTVLWVRLPRQAFEGAERFMVSALAYALALDARDRREARPLIVEISTPHDPMTPNALFRGGIIGAFCVSEDGSPEQPLRRWLESGVRLWVGPNTRIREDRWQPWLGETGAAEIGKLHATSMWVRPPEGHAGVVRVLPVESRQSRSSVVEITQRDLARIPSNLSDEARRILEAPASAGNLLAKLASADRLRQAWFRVRSTGSISRGADGIDLLGFAQHADDELARLGEVLLDGTYRPVPLVRVRLRKASGGERVIGVLAVRDRVAQMACLEVIDPLLDPVLSDRCHAYRRGRSAGLAVLSIRAALRGKQLAWALQCDIEKCFDTVDHERLMSLVARRVQDPGVLDLLRAWARADVLIGRDVIANELGVVQGSSLSPLLANVYLSELDAGLEAESIEFARYADDLFIATRTEADARQAQVVVECLLRDRLRMRLNPQKTTLGRADAGVDYLGFRVTPETVGIARPKLERFRDRMGALLRTADAAQRLDSLAQRDEALDAARHLLRGFGAYYRSVGDEPGVARDLACAEADLAQLETTLSSELRTAPRWKARPRLIDPETFAAPADAATGYPLRDDDPPGRSSPLIDAPTPTASADADANENVFVDDGFVWVTAHGAHLGLVEGDLRVRARRREIARIELASIRAVYVSAFGTSVSTALATWLSVAGVPLVMANPGSTDICVIAPTDTGSARLREQQAVRRRDPVVLAAGLQILSAKVGSQAALLRYYAKYRRKVADPIHVLLGESATRIQAQAQQLLTLGLEDRDALRASAMGHEGTAAATYWSAVGSMLPKELEFPGRRTRGAEDCVNQAINYLYGALYSEAWSALARAGLDPCVGILHGDSRGSASLVFDVVEEFRAPVVDRLVISLFGRGFRPRIGRSGWLSTSSRRTLSRAWGRELGRHVAWLGKRPRVRELIHRQARALAAVFGGESASYRAYRMRW